MAAAPPPAPRKWGDNAITAMMEALAAQGVAHPLVSFYHRYIGSDLNGVRLGCGLEDLQSGKLTLNAGLLRTEGETLALTLDVRSPVTFSREDVEAPLSRACAAFGIRCECTESTDSVYMDENGPVVRALVSVYRDVTGDDSRPAVIGGTYARAMPGIVAFGPMRPGRECTEHQRDEYILLEDLLAAKEIYRRAMEKLANLKG